MGEGLNGYIEGYETDRDAKPEKEGYQPAQVVTVED
jgi:hypothetical protein